MSRIYQMPPDTREKEKIIGGIFTLGQMMWIVGGVVLFLLVVILLYPLMKFFSIIFGLPFIPLGFLFAIKKVNDIPLPTYLKFKHRYKKVTKYYVNAGFHSELEFSNWDDEENNWDERG